MSMITTGQRMIFDYDNDHISKCIKFVLFSGSGLEEKWNRGEKSGRVLLVRLLIKVRKLYLTSYFLSYLISDDIREVIN